MMTLVPQHKVQLSESNADSMLSSASHPTEIRHREACGMYKTPLSVSFLPFPHLMVIFPFPIVVIEVPLIPPIRHVGIGFSSENLDLLGEQWLVAPESMWNSWSVTVNRAHSSAVSRHMCVWQSLMGRWFCCSIQWSRYPGP